MINPWRSCFARRASMNALSRGLIARSRQCLAYPGKQIGVYEEPDSLTSRRSIRKAAQRTESDADHLLRRLLRWSWTGANWARRSGYQRTGVLRRVEPSLAPLAADAGSTRPPRARDDAIAGAWTS